MRAGGWTDHAGSADTTRCDQHRLHRTSAGRTARLVADGVSAHALSGARCFGPAFLCAVRRMLDATSANLTDHGWARNPNSCYNGSRGE